MLRYDDRVTTTKPDFIPLFLPSSEALTGGSGALKAATRQALAALAASQVRTVVMVDSTWRSPTLDLGTRTEGASRLLVGALKRELAERDFWPRSAAPAWEQSGRDYLGLLGAAAPEAVIAIGVPPHAPERTMAVGEAIAAACAEEQASTALVVTGALTRGGAPSDPAPLAFAQTLRQLLEQGAGSEILNAGGDLWIAGRPDAELAHLFVLLGAAPAHLATFLAEERSSDASYAVISFAPAPTPPPAPERPAPTVFPLTLKGASPRA